MYGYAEHDLGDVLELWRKLVHPDDQPTFVANVQQCLSGLATRFACEMRVLCKSGAWKWILCRGAVFSIDREGKAERLIGTHTDITSYKQATASG
jgi:PAS domain S-box-containing protein